MNLYDKNLFDEIYEVLKEHDLSIYDIDYVLIDNFQVDVLTFLNACYKINYDNSNDRVFIKLTLFIVLNNGDWLERYSHDGFEWFEYRSYPKPLGKLNSCSISDMVDIIINK